MYSKLVVSVREINILGVLTCPSTFCHKEMDICFAFVQLFLVLIVKMIFNARVKNFFHSTYTFCSLDFSSSVIVLMI